MSEPTLGEEQDEAAFQEWWAKEWPDTRPGTSRGIVGLVARRAWQAGRAYGLSLRGCCRPSFPLTEEGIEEYIAYLKEAESR